MAKRKLYRSNDDKIVAGIIGGIAEYFDVDSVFLRVIWILILVFTGFIPAIIAYLLALLVVPRKPKVEATTVETS